MVDKEFIKEIRAKWPLAEIVTFSGKITIYWDDIFLTIYKAEKGQVYFNMGNQTTGSIFTKLRLIKSYQDFWKFMENF